MLDIPIVVVGYNRVPTLQRLLGSLAKAHYSDSVRLIVSIDGGGSKDVVTLAEEFPWPFGDKEVIEQTDNLGLRKHILLCGELATKYDGIILLEDDLLVSPWFYYYAQKSANFYQDSDKVCGIALYSPCYNETACLPFYPLGDGTDIYFMQLACSWGQIWLRNQWELFRKWYQNHQNIDFDDDFVLPFNIRLWPATSWKKYFIKYMISTDRYFAYPRCSYSTNFGDLGQHHYGVKLFQVPLIGGKKEFSFSKFEDSQIFYDAFCELTPQSFRDLSGCFIGDDFQVDLYGTREDQQIGSEFVLTIKKCSMPLETYGKEMIPMENNIIYSIPGDEYCFVRVEDVEPIKNIAEYVFTKSNDWEEQKYYYPLGQGHYQKVTKRLAGLEEQMKMKDEQLEVFRKQHDIIIGQLKDVTQKYYQADKSAQLLRQSVSYRLGNKIVTPFSKLKKLRKS